MEQILTNILLYSLALGLVLAVFTGLMLTVTRSCSPMLRYRLLTFLLLLFTAGIAITGYMTFKAQGTDAVTIAGSDAVHHSGGVAEAELAATGGTERLTDLGGYIYQFMNSNARLIALAWLLIVAIKSLKLGSSLMELHYLKNRKVFPAGKYWEDELGRLASQIGLSRAVRIAQSSLTQVPMVIGHFKPMILIPLGMITAIKPQEIEMILLHELAHIKRMDFLVNLLQHVLEILFFFNPAVLWLSALIRRERENCCDEMVLRQSTTKQTYIQALLSFREYQLAAPAYAMAFARESNLVSRVKRMVSQKNASMNLMEKTAMLAAIVLLCSFSLFRSAPVSADLAKSKVPFPQQPVDLPSGAPAKPYDNFRPVADNKGSEGVVEGHVADTSKKVKKVEKKTTTIITTDDSSKFSINVNTNSLTNTGIAINLDNKVLDKLTSSLSSIVSSTVNMALDSSAHHISKALSETALLSKPAPGPEPKPKDLTTALLEALEKAGINTKGEKFRFHVDNETLTVNGKKQPQHIHNRVVAGFLKHAEDQIDFTYTRRGGYTSASSEYHKK